MLKKTVLCVALAFAVTAVQASDAAPSPSVAFVNSAAAIDRVGGVLTQEAGETRALIPLALATASSESYLDAIASIKDLAGNRGRLSLVASEATIKQFPQSAAGTYCRHLTDKEQILFLNNVSLSCERLANHNTRVPAGFELVVIHGQSPS